MSELELKFHIPTEARASLREALLQHGAQAIRLQARYFDTEDSRLARHRVALRLRQEGEHWVQTLKAAGDSPAHHLEHEVALDLPAGTGEPRLDLQRHAGSDAGNALLAALGDADPMALRQLHGTDIQRLALVLTLESGTQLELAFDEGRVIAGSRAQDLCELEIEHKAGPCADLFALARSWVRHGQLSLCTTAKSARGERLRQQEPAPAVKAAPTALPPHGDGEALFRAMLRSAMQQVLDNASELAEAPRPAPQQAETVHQMRVGLRRLRSLLRELPELAGPLPPDVLPPLTEVFRELGRQRDSETVAAAVQPMLQAASAPSAGMPAAACIDLAATVRGSGFQCALLQLLARLHPDAPAARYLKHRAARALIARRLDHLHRQLARAARHFEELPAEQQHLARIRLKRLRYLAELAGGLWPAADVERYLSALKPAQDTLGHHHDVAAAAAAYREQAKQEPEAWFAAGYLQASLHDTARAAGKSLRQARRAARFWHG